MNMTLQLSTPTVADLGGGGKGAIPPPKRQKSPFALMNYKVLQLQMT